MNADEIALIDEVPIGKGVDQWKAAGTDYGSTNSFASSTSSGDRTDPSHASSVGGFFIGGRIRRHRSLGRKDLRNPYTGFIHGKIVVPVRANNVSED